MMRQGRHERATIGGGTGEDRKDRISVAETRVQQNWCSFSGLDCSRREERGRYNSRARRSVAERDWSSRSTNQCSMVSPGDPPNTQGIQQGNPLFSASMNGYSYMPRVLGAIGWPCGKGPSTTTATGPLRGRERSVASPDEQGHDEGRGKHPPPPPPLSHRS